MSSMRRLQSAVFLILLAGCGDPVRPARVTPASPDSIRISAAADSVWVGRTIRLSATGFGAHAGATSFTWSSTDTTRLLIDSAGVATAIRPGAVVVRVERDSALDTFTVRGVLPEVRSSVGFTALAPGNYFWLALGDDGYAYMASGGGPADSGISASKLEGTPTFASLSTAWRHACGLTGSGEVWCWGNNSHGELGLGTDEPVSTSTPVRAASPMLFAAMTAGGHGATCGARVADSLLYCWGHNDSYQLGRPPRVTDDPAIEPTDALLRAKLVTTSDFHTCAITPEDETYCWGNAGPGQLGSPVDSATPVPQRVDVGEPFRNVTVGPFFTCGATISGAVYCWGDNSDGQLGIGTTDDLPHPEPARVAGLPPIASVAAGYSSMCATSVEGEGYCWGTLNALQLAAQTQAPVTRPLAIAPGYKFRDLRPYHGTLCGVTIEGRLYCW